MNARSARAVLAPAAVCALAIACAIGPAGAGQRGTGAASAGPAGKIRHVIVFFQENRSFDEVLGAYCVQHHRCNGSIGPVHLKDGSVQPLTKSDDVVSPDPPHSVHSQDVAIDGGKMDGWGTLGSGCISPGPNNCLTYYAPSQIPSMAALADRYVVSDRTFSMQNSASFGGHMWVASATQDGFIGDVPCCARTEVDGWGCDSHRFETWIDAAGNSSYEPSCVPAPTGYLDPVKYPYRGAYGPTPVKTVPTIFDRLDAAHLAWKLYENVYKWAVCPTFAKCLYGPQHKNMVNTSNILDDAKHGTLPAYSVLLPSGPGGTGQHPPTSMLVGDNWIAEVMTALQASPQWSSTAVFITYDDCGCFYDHVPPGQNPDGTGQGPREPMIIASPYAKPGGTDSHAASIASVLHFTEEALGLASLGSNDAKAYDYAGSFNFAQPSTVPPARLSQHVIPDATRQRLASVPPDPGDDPT